mmetsp:Transcript_9421/g.17198  ORF Transcript_9421/g.17198 Transcript_9421/m.17198 type:complete len:296 (-) Transcript_9421:392-1279(-)
MSMEVPIKLVVVGGAKAGKTAMVQRFKKRNAELQEEYEPTIGFNVNTFQLTKTIQKQNLDICLQIWDVSHKELDGSHLETIFEDASGIMLVMDPTSQDSLKALDLWRDVVERHKPKDHTPIALTVTKLDLCQAPPPQSAASLLASSLAMTTQSSFAKLFGAGSGGEGKLDALERKKRLKIAKTGPCLQDLSAEKLREVMDKYCEMANIREWKQCSSKTGKDVKDALYSLVNLSLKPALAQQDLKKTTRELAVAAAEEKFGSVPQQLFSQEFDEIPEYNSYKSAGGDDDADEAVEC